MTTIDDLIDDIVDGILQNIPLTERKETRCQLMLVSQKWKELANSRLGLQVLIGSSPWTGLEESVDGSDHIDLLKIEEIGISHCHVGEILHPDDIRPKPTGLVNWIWTKVKDIFSKTDIPTFKHPNLLQLFRFNGVIRNDYFQALVTPKTTYTLRQIQFNHSALSLLEPESLENIIAPSLQYVEVMADFSYIFREIDDSKILTNILTFLHNSFPRLTACNLYIPFDGERELEITKTFFNFLLRNCHHLKFLEVFYFYMLTDEDDIIDDTQPSTIEDEELKGIAGMASQNLNLKVLIAHINVDRLRCFYYWQLLLHQQTKLEYLVVLSDHQVYGESLIHRLAPTIKIILGTVDTRDPLDGQSSPLDCAIFQDCSHLVHLSMNGRYEDYILLPNTPGLINPELLPNSLRHIDLSKLPVLTTDLEKILLHSSNLKHFVGKLLGRTGRMGLTLDIINAMVERRQLNWFHFTALFNGVFPVDGISNGHPTRPSLLMMRDDYFCAKLSRNGYYVMSSPFDELLANMSIHSQNTG